MQCRTLNTSEFIHKRGELFSGAKGIKDDINLEILKILEEIFNNIYDNFIYSCDSKQFINISINSIDKEYHYHFSNSANIPIKVINDMKTYDLKQPIGTEVILPYHLFNTFQTSTKYNDEINRMTCGLNGYGLKWITHRFTKYKIIVVYEDLIYTQIGNDYKITSNNNNLPNSYTIYFNINYELTKPLYNTIPFCSLRIYEMLICLYLNGTIPSNITINNNKNIIMNGGCYDFWISKLYNKPILFSINSYLLSESTNPNIPGKVKNYFKLICCKKETGMKNVIVLNSLRIVSVDFLDKIYKIFNNRLFKDGEKRSVEQYCTFAIIGNFNNLIFDAQSKNRITTEYIIDEDLEKQIKNIKSDIFDFIYHNDAIKAYKEKRKLLKGKLNNINYKPATKLKSKESELCITEGLSPKTSVEEAIKNNNLIGIFAASGKWINALSNYYKALVNDSIINLSLILDYAIDGTEKKDIFNYNKIIIMADADIDGIHISCLIINIIKIFFPKLLNNVYIMRFPLIIDLISSNPKRTIKEYYEETNNFKNPIYCKGLCSYEKVDMKMFFNNRDKYLYSVIMDDVNFLNNIFSKDTQYRKQLYNSDDLNEEIWNDNKILLTKYIEKEYKKFLRGSLKRSIPNILDGFTESIRKIVYVLMQKKVGQQYNLANFTAEVSLQTNYHHGNTSLELSCKSLGFSTKNIKLIQTHGTFGTIKYKHHDCGASRYIRLSKPDYLDKLFIKESFNIIPYNTDEGQIIEPKFLLPLLPFILINGVNNVSTGYSSCIPGHKFEYMKSYVNEYLNSKIKNTILEISFPKISYDFFKYEKNIEENESGYNSRAEIKVIQQNRFSILEFPLTYTLENIIDTCNTIEEKSTKQIVEDHSEGENINIIVNGDITKYNFSDSNNINITVFDDEEKLCVFKNKEELFESWFAIRYKWLIKEITEIINCLNIKRNKIHTKYILIKYFIDNHIITHKEQKQISVDLKAEAIYSTLYQREVNEENLEFLNKSIIEIDEKINYYKNINPLEYWKLLLTF
jgi:DNA gyrase/topoisomerase IV subunit B